MAFLQYIVPLSVFVYILSRCRGNLLYVCTIATFLGFGRSFYIDSWKLAVRVPMAPLVLDLDDVLFGGMVLAWVYVRQKRPMCQRLTWRPDLLTVTLFLALLVVVHPPLALLNGVDLFRALRAGRQWFYLPLNIFIWVDVFRRFTRDEVLQWLGSLSLLTVLVTPLYVLSAVGFAIYPYEPYVVEVSGTGRIVRDYMTYPGWYRYALAFYLVQLVDGLHRARVLLAVGAIIIGVLFSFTRTYIVLALVQVSIALLFALIVRKGAFRVLPWFVIAAAATAIVIVSLNSFFPEHVEYMRQRFVGLQTYGLSEVNVRGRLDTVQMAIAYVRSVGPVFGSGFAASVKPGLFPDLGGVYVADTSWNVFAMRLGWSGVAVMGLILATFTGNSLGLVLEKNQIRSRMGLLLFLGLVYDIASMVTTGRYLGGSTGSTIFLALIAVEARDLWAVNPVTVPIRSQLSGINLNGFTRDDEFRLWRRFALAGLVGFIAIRLGRYVVR